MCRCTGYHAIIDAVEAVIAKKRQQLDGVRSGHVTSTGIGARIPRRELKRLLSGHGRYIDDIKLPRMLHACFVRSPHPHAKVAFDRHRRREARARRRRGASPRPTSIRAASRSSAWRCTGRAIASAPQSSVRRRARGLAGPAGRLIVGRKPCAGRGRRRARQRSNGQPLPAVGDQIQAIAPGAPVIHASLGDNVAFDFSIEKGEPAKAFAEADVVIEEELRFERQMAMTLEARGLIADFNPGDGSLTVIHSHQSPFQMQQVFSKHLGIPEHQVRVVVAGRRRRLRHEAQHLHRRDRHGGGEHAARPAGEVLRRPAGVVRLRRAGARPPHQVPHRREEDRRDPGDGDGRHRRGRRLRHAACASTSPKA